jgi:enoyl-[acyl-carrier protein] reductase I
MASKVRAPSRRSCTVLPLDTSAAAMRHRPRANDGPVSTPAGAGTPDGDGSEVVVASGDDEAGATASALIGVEHVGAGSRAPCDGAAGAAKAFRHGHRRAHHPIMLNIDLSGRRALVAGVADDGGYGFAIAKALAIAGATVSVATWPPALNIFRNLLDRGKMDDSRRMPDGSTLTFEQIYPFDAGYDTLADAPEDVRTNKRYKDVGDFSVAGLATRLIADFGARPLDILVHSLANGPDVRKPLLETSRAGYLAALDVSAYSLVALVARLGPLFRAGGSVASLTYMAGQRVIPGYGGGMSSAKAALESDTRVLAYEAGRKYGIRVNTVSAGPLASRAASAIGIIDKMVDYCSANSPLPEPVRPADVAHTVAFLASPLGAGITGATVYVDKGYHAMGMAVKS